MTPYEVMLSESQERMLIVAKRGREDEVLRIFHKWDLDAAVIGRVTDDGRVRILDGGKEVANLPVGPLTEGAPLYDRPTRRPAEQDALQAFDPATVPAPKDLGETLQALLARPTIASKEWVFRQYDHTVRLGAVVRPGAADAAVVRVERTGKGLAMAVDCNARFVFLDPYEGARLAVAECTRNVSCVGGEPLGLTDCLNFGNPERPEIMWQFAEATRGIAAACRELAVPVVSGNVSLYNETDGRAILPTPTVAVVGLLPDVAVGHRQHLPQPRRSDRHPRRDPGPPRRLGVAAHGRGQARRPSAPARRQPGAAAADGGPHLDPDRLALLGARHQRGWTGGGPGRMLHGRSRPAGHRRHAPARPGQDRSPRLPLRRGRLAGGGLLPPAAPGRRAGVGEGGRRPGVGGGDGRAEIASPCRVCSTFPVAELSRAWRSGIPAVVKQPTHL